MPDRSWLVFVGGAPEAERKSICKNMGKQTQNIEGDKVMTTIYQTDSCLWRAALANFWGPTFKLYMDLPGASSCFKVELFVIEEIENWETVVSNLT